MNNNNDGVENIIEGLAGAFEVSENNIYGEHPHFSSYKNVGKYALSQRKRREEFLQRQANSRESFRNRVRLNYKESIENEDENDNLANINHIDEVDSIKTETETSDTFDNFAGSNTKGFEGMDFGKWGVISNKKFKSTLKNKNKNFETQTINQEHLFTGYLMFSEWLVDIPQISTFSTEWIMLPCPIGKRTLIVALNGVTTAYNKNGVKLCQFKTKFPGGNFGDNGICSLLDCIFDKQNNRYYILDLICWNNSHFVDSEFISRRQFLSKHFSEVFDNSDIKNSTEDTFSFYLLPSCYCTNEEMTKLMFKNYDFDLDGLLFYYFKVKYTPGQTPLVGWLKPWMLPEILNVNVPTKYIDQKGSYNTSKQFIEHYNKKYKFKSSIIKESNDIVAESDNLINVVNEQMQS